MNNAPTPGHHVPDPETVTVTARLTAAEKSLDEIVRRLDEMKDFLTLLDHAQSNHRCTVPD